MKHCAVRFTSLRFGFDRASFRPFPRFTFNALISYFSIAEFFLIFSARHGFLSPDRLLLYLCRKKKNRTDRPIANIVVTKTRIFNNVPEMFWKYNPPVIYFHRGTGETVDDRSLFIIAAMILQAFVRRQTQRSISSNVIREIAVGI